MTASGPQTPGVLLLTTSYPVDQDSVSGVFVHRLAAALDARCRLRVLTPAPGGAPPPVAHRRPELQLFRYAPRRWQVLAHGAGGIPAVLGRSPWARLLVFPLLGAMLWATLRAAQGQQAIIANWSVCGLIAGLVGRLRAIPVIVVLRGEDANRASRSLAFRLALRACTMLCSKVVTVSVAMAQRLRALDLVAPDKIEVIANGVGKAFTAVADAQPPAHELRLLFIGSLIPRKSVGTLLDAMALLSPQVTLRVVGEGSEQPALEEQATCLKLGERVEFLPFQPAERMPELLAEAHALVLPSLAEGRPNVVLEALAAGRPVVASDIDGVRELLGDDQRGLRFAARDAQALADRVQQLLQPDRYRRLAANGRAFIRDEGLDWTRTASRYLELVAHTRQQG